MIHPNFTPELRELFNRRYPATDVVGAERDWIESTVRANLSETNTATLLVKPKSKQPTKRNRASIVLIYNMWHDWRCAGTSDQRAVSHGFSGFRERGSHRICPEEIVLEMHPFRATLRRFETWKGLIEDQAKYYAEGDEWMRDIQQAVAEFPQYQ